MKINDKVLHITISAIISAICYYLLKNVMLSIVLSFAMGVGKEVVDVQTTGFSFADLLADLVGIGLGIFIIRGVI